MFEKLDNKIIPNKYTVVINDTDEIVWMTSEEVRENDWEHVDEYITTNENLLNLVGIGFYAQNTAVKLSFRYKLALNPGSVLINHHRVFIKPPIDLLRVLYNHIPYDVRDFLLKSGEKYRVSDLQYDNATWLMSTILGAKD